VKKLKHFVRSVRRSGCATGAIIPPLYPLGYVLGAGLAAFVLASLGLVEGFDEEG
jgi:hypothetical protein